MARAANQAILGAAILATVFIPAYYRRNVTTPYQLLETRFGPGARLATSIAYMVGRTFASGARIYVGALPAAFLLFGGSTGGNEVEWTIAGFMALGIIITALGGISSVIWVDLLQVIVYLGAALATFGLSLYVIDWREGMPWLWCVWEGTAVTGFGITIVLLARREPRREGEGGALA